MSIKFLEVKRAYYADPENVAVEARLPAGMWNMCVAEPAWEHSFEYRIRPRTIRIGELEVPEPVREALADGGTYYGADPSDEDFYMTLTWDDDAVDFMLMGRGLIHLTKEAAIEHAKALILVSGGTVE